MPNELKGLNYYSKVFKRINYRLSNSNFWVVINHQWAYPRVSCLVTFYVLCWLLSYTRAFHHPWVLQMFCRFFSLLDLFLDLCESSYWDIPPLALFYWGIRPLWVHHISYWFHGRSTHLLILLSLLLGHTPLALFYWGIPPLFGFTASRVDFMVVRHNCQSLRVIT